MFGHVSELFKDAKNSAIQYYSSYNLRKTGTKPNH